MDNKHEKVTSRFQCADFLGFAEIADRQVRSALQTLPIDDARSIPLRQQLTDDIATTVNHALAHQCVQHDRDVCQKYRDDEIQCQKYQDHVLVSTRTGKHDWSIAQENQGRKICERVALRNAIDQVSSILGLYYEPRTICNITPAAIASRILEAHQDITPPVKPSDTSIRQMYYNDTPLTREQQAHLAHLRLYPND